MRYLCLFPAALLVGVVVYAAALMALFRQTISLGDLPSVVFLLAIGVFVCGPFISIPALLGLRYLLDSWEPVTAFGFCGAMLGVFPVALVLVFMGASPSAVFSPEAALFSLAFASVGVVFGIGIAIARDQEKKL